MVRIEPGALRYEADIYPIAPSLHLGCSAYPLGLLRGGWLWTLDPEPFVALEHTEENAS